MPELRRTRWWRRGARRCRLVQVARDGAAPALRLEVWDSAPGVSVWRRLLEPGGRVEPGLTAAELVFHWLPSGPVTAADALMGRAFLAGELELEAGGRP